MSDDDEGGQVKIVYKKSIPNKKSHSLGKVGLQNKFQDDNSGNEQIRKGSMMTDVQQFGKNFSRAEMMVNKSVRKRGKANSTEKLPPLPVRSEIQISSNDENRQKPSHAANFLNKVLGDENPKPAE